MRGTRRTFRALMLSPPSLVRPMALAIGAALAVAGAARAVPRLDLSRYPMPPAGQSRWVIQLPGVLPPNPNPAMSANPADWRVELILGQEVEVDCNRAFFSGRIRSETIPAAGTKVYRVSNVSPIGTTRMACPPGTPRRKVFLPMGGKPFVVPYNVSRPIVVYAPRDLEVRWRLWKAERDQRPAQRL